MQLIKKQFIDWPLTAIVVIVASLMFMPLNASAAYSTPITLSPVSTAYFPSIDGNNQALHSVWAEDDSAGNRIIKYARSTDGGNSFPANERKNISSGTGTATSPSLAMGGTNGSNIHIVWEEVVNGNSEILYAKSTDRGVTFGSPVNLSGTTGSTAVSPQVRTGTSGRVFIVWVDELGDGTTQIFYRRSIDDGVTFTAAQNLSNSTENVDSPTIATNGNTIFVAWAAQGPTYGLMKTLSVDNGVTFNSHANIAADSVTSIFAPTARYDGSGILHVAAGVRGNFGDEVYYYRSANGGSTFSAPVNLSNTPNEQSQSPTIITVGNTTVDVLWSEHVCPTENVCGQQIYQRESANSGTSFGTVSATDTLPGSSEDSESVRIGNTTYVLYQDGNTIMFKKGS
jgi:hypothetical protein